MASLIEHKSKREAYMRCYTWGESPTMDKKSITWHDKQMYDKHVGYCIQMEASRQYWYGTPPRSKLLNWLAHKLLELAWGKKLL